MRSQEIRLQGLKPVIPSDCNILILGSFPSVASLSAQQYYAFPRNQFWPIWSVLLDQPLTDWPYAKRLACLSKHKIGIWDMYAACERIGSADSEIKRAQQNDFDYLKRLSPYLRYIGLNGATAGKLAPRLQQWGWEATVLPSTSPAYASKCFTEKLAVWKKWFDRVQKQALAVETCSINRGNSGNTKKNQACKAS